MILPLTLFIGLTALVLIGLSVMIFKIGEALADCPVTGRAARAGSLTIVTGFVAIGAGGVFLIAAGTMVALPLFTAQGVTFALGLSCLCLGLGFTHAITTLRSVVAQAAAQAKAVA